MKSSARLTSRRLNEHDAALIKSLWASGWLQSDIASLFGTHSGTVSTILAGGRFATVAPADLASAAARADLAEVQAAWSLRMARLLSAVLSRGGAIVRCIISKLFSFFELEIFRIWFRKSSSDRCSRRTTGVRNP